LGVEVDHIWEGGLPFSNMCMLEWLSFLEKTIMTTMGIMHNARRNHTWHNKPLSQEDISKWAVVSIRTNNLKWVAT